MKLPPLSFCSIHIRLNKMIFAKLYVQVDEKNEAIVFIEEIKKSCCMLFETSPNCDSEIVLRIGKL